MNGVNIETKSSPIGEECPMKLVQKLIAGKWKILILWYLSIEPRRFGELNRLLDGISRGVLTEQLKQLQKDKLIYREVYDEIPVKVVYSLTEIGMDFTQVLNVMGKWGKEYFRKVNSEFVKKE